VTATLPAHDTPPSACKAVVRWPAPLAFASLLARRATTITPSLAEPAVEDDGHVGRLGQCGPQLIVDVPILA
jgi:hypothetical protein